MFRNKFQWNYNQNSNIFVQENAFENVICKMAAILPQCQAVKQVLKATLTGLLVDIFCWGSEAPTIWISRGPKQNLKGPSIEIYYQFSNFGGPLGPQAKILQGPHWIFRSPGPLPPGPREPCLIKIHYKFLDLGESNWALGSNFARTP